jgi:hypothetical protein
MHLSLKWHEDASVNFQGHRSIISVASFQGITAGCWRPCGPKRNNRVSKAPALEAGRCGFEPRRVRHLFYRLFRGHILGKTKTKGGELDEPRISASDSAEPF